MAAPRPRRQSTAPMRDLGLLDLAGHPLADCFPGAVALGFRACDPGDDMMPGRRFIDDVGALVRHEAGACWQGVIRLEAVIHAE